MQDQQRLNLVNNSMPPKQNQDWNRKQVAVNLSEVTTYPSAVPFHPPIAYPELDRTETHPSNGVYPAVREVLRGAGLDIERYGTPEWNPFGSIVEPGMTVFIKPNTVRHYHTGGGNLLSIINHGSVLRPVLDYVIKALHGDGRIIIGDSQVIFGRFDKAYTGSAIDPLLAWYREQTRIPIECFDLRTVRGVRTYLYGKWGRKKVEQDPRGFRFVDLHNMSSFNGIDPTRLRIAIASYKNMIEHHSNGKHQYLFPQSVLDSDAIISISKLKTHRRTAVTLAIKNFMGIPAWKDTLPHFIVGSVEEGGDQYHYPSARKRLCTRLHDQIQSSPYIPVKFACAVVKKAVWNTHRVVRFKDDIYEAMWYRNDTLWRTLNDLNRAVIFADRKGQIQMTPQRRFFRLIDGFIGGEKNGPVGVDQVDSGVVMAGYNPVALDIIGATLMGFDIEKIPMIWNAIDGQDQVPNPAPSLFNGSPEDLQVSVDNRTFTFDQFKAQYNLRFEPHPSWKGHIER